MPGDKYFLWNSIPNIVLIAGLVYYLFIRRNVGAVLAVMFVYLSLHGGYAVFAAATGDGINTMNALHYEGSDLGAKIIGASFLFICSVLLFLRANEPFVELKRNTSLVFGIVSITVIFLLLMVYGALDLPNVPRGKLLTMVKESVFGSLVWMGALIFSVVVKESTPYLIERKNEWLPALGFVGLITMACGFFEISTGMVWAGTYYVTGFSYRASGAMFNPNVLGFWSALMLIMISLGFHLRWVSKQVAFWGAALVALGLILSSSRSGFVLSLMNVAVISLLFLWRPISPKQPVLERLWPMVSFGFAFALWGVLIQLTGALQYTAVTTLRANLLRFQQLPVDVFWIFMMKIYLPMADKFEMFFRGPLMKFGSDLDSLLGIHLTQTVLESLHLFQPGWRQAVVTSIDAATNTNAAGKILESLNGRTLLEYISDNSFLSIFAVGGVLALALWLLLWGISFYLAIRKLKNAPGLFSSYALVALVFCFVSGFFLRSPQLFPVWVFISMTLGACYCWWLSDAAPVRLSKAPATVFSAASAGA